MSDLNCQVIKGKLYYIDDNHNWIWNHQDYSDNELFDINNRSVLADRGNFLDIVDKRTDILGTKDLDNVLKKNKDNDKLIISWGPGAGKTVAIRQFVVDSLISGADTSGIVVCKLQAEVQKLYYDINAAYLHKKGHLPKEEIGTIFPIMSYYSGSADQQRLKAPTDLSQYRWIIATHERLFIESPYVLQTFNFMPRNYLFIDEFPTSFYKAYNVNQGYSKYLRSLANLCQLSYDLDELKATSYKKISDKFSQLLNAPKMLNRNWINLCKILVSPTSDISDLELRCDKDQQRAGRKPKEGVEIDKKKNGKFNLKDRISVANRFSMDRVAFLNSLLYIKLAEQDAEFERTKSSEVYKKSLIISLNDICIAKQNIIFDGTGDILFSTDDKNMAKWKVIRDIRDSRYRRKILIGSETKIYHTNVDRNNTIDEIATDYSRIITDIVSFHIRDDEMLLIYTHKDNYKQHKSLIEKLKSVLDKDICNRCKFITYQSGNERSSNNYINCTNILILGKWTINLNVIQILNELNNTKLTADQYTIALIIQAIYRTSLRIGKAVNLFITDDYKANFRYRLMSYFDACYCYNSSNFVDINSNVSQPVRNIGNVKVLRPDTSFDKNIIYTSAELDDDKKVNKNKKNRGRPIKYQIDAMKLSEDLIKLPNSMIEGNYIRVYKKALQEVIGCKSNGIDRLSKILEKNHIMFSVSNGKRGRYGYPPVFLIKNALIEEK